MDKVHGRAVNIAQVDGEGDLSDDQQLFNSLTGQIEARRARLRAWETMQNVFHKQYVEELLPLARESTDLQVRMVYRLNDAFDDRSLTKAERLTLSDLIARMAGRLVDESDDAGLKAIRNMHAGADQDGGGAAAPAARAHSGKPVADEVAAAGTGEGPDSDPLRDWRADSAAAGADELLQYEQAELQARLAREAAKEKARAAREQARAEKQAAGKPAAQSAQQQAAALLEAAQAEAGKSLREVYRKLASAWHPDREPDPDERVRKTALMQEANRAYEKKDLLRLLELRLELEHIGQHSSNGIGNLDEARLRHYNQILKEQLGDLDEEIRHLEDGFRRSYGLRPSSAIEPDTVLRILRKDVAGLRDHIRDMAMELRLLEDIDRLKDWLGHLKTQFKQR